MKSYLKDVLAATKHAVFAVLIHFNELIDFNLTFFFELFFGKQYLEVINIYQYFIVVAFLSGTILKFGFLSDSHFNALLTEDALTVF